MLCFSHYVNMNTFSSLNVYQLNDSVYIWNCYKPAQFFKQKNNHEVSCDQNFCMKFFTTPNSKNIIVTLRIVPIEISELIFLLMSCFHVGM